MTPNFPDTAAPNTPAKPHLSPRLLAIEGWSSRLAALAGGFVLLAGASGLWLYLAPFSVSSQLLVLVHVALGLALFGPLLWYAGHHLAGWMRQKATAAMFLGYALLVGALVAVVSGLVGTGYGLFGIRLPYAWDLVHLVSGLSVFGLATAHLLAAWLRRLPATRKDEQLRQAMRLFRRRGSLGIATVLISVTAVPILWRQTSYRFPVPEDYSLPSYAQEFEEYRGNPFAPTFARTNDSKMVKPELLANSESCGTTGCHTQILEEWQPSAHRFAAMNPPFLEIQRNFAADREPAETRYCAGCHDPISLFAGAKDLHALELSSQGVTEGISCAVCHSISQVDERGNADYVVTPPHKYLWEQDVGLRKAVSDFLIRTYPRQHLADYDRALLRTPEFCAACHKQFIPEALNRFGMVPSQNQYDEWKNAHWHTDSPETDLSCRDCHMRLVDSTDPGRGEAGDLRRSGDDQAHRHHGTVATNNFMPEVLDLPNWRQHVRLTNEWMRGETVLPEIAHIWPEGPVAGVTIAAPEQVGAGEDIELRVVVTNRKAGHTFTTGPLDFVRSWIHLTVLGDAGATVVEFGALDPETRRIEDRAGTLHRGDNARDQGTLVLESIPIDEHGEELRQHELWRKAGGRGKRVIFPGYSDSQTYQFTIPANQTGPLTVLADLNYRRYRQEFLELVVPELESSTGVQQPIITQSSAQTKIKVSPADG